MLSHFSHVQLFATLRTVARQALLSMGFCRQEHWSGLLYPSPGDLPQGSIPHLPASLALQVDSSPTEPPGKPNVSLLCRLLGMTVYVVTSASFPWFLHPCIFPLGDMEPYKGLGFSIYIVYWRMVPHPCRVLLLSWCFSCTFSRPVHCSMRSASSEWCGR